MNKDVLVTLHGTQDIEGDMQSVELITFGKFYKRDKKYYLVYKEKDDNGEDSRTTLKIENDNKVIMTRFGANTSQLIFEKGVQHIGHYNTLLGALVISVSAKNIVSDVSDIGGKLSVYYSIDINHAHSSNNRIDIEIKEATPPDYNSNTQ